MTFILNKFNVQEALLKSNRVEVKSLQNGIAATQKLFVLLKFKLVCLISGYFFKTNEVFK